MKTHSDSQMALLRELGLLGPVLVALLAAGCASTEVTYREQLVHDQLPRPATIWVCDFAASAAELPPDSALASQGNLTIITQTPQQIEMGHELGATIAAQLIEEIRGMGLVAAPGKPGTRTQVNDILLRGYLLSMDEGSAAKRFAIGFGSGSSEMRTLVEGFQVTPTGFRKLGSGVLDSGGTKSPGTAVGAATWIATGNPAGFIVSSGMKVAGEATGRNKLEGRAKATAKEIAEVLKQRFKEQGWIQ